MTRASFLPSFPNSTNPERIGIAQPRVARHELPWVDFIPFPTLKELNQKGRQSVMRVLQPFQGWADLRFTQGRPRRAGPNPGLNDHKPVGLADCSSFPNFIGERPLLLAKFHFALTGRGNEVAQIIAFPNKIWERGIWLIIGAAILLFGSANVAFAQEPFAKDDYRVSHADVAYFFDAISFDKGVWRFEFSKSSDGMQWRTNAQKPGSDSPDATGLCKYKQILTVPDGTWLEIVGKDFNISFLRYDPGSYTVRAQLKPGFRDSFKNRTREATELKASSDGTYMVLIGID